MTPNRWKLHKHQIRLVERVLERLAPLPKTRSEMLNQFMSRIPRTSTRVVHYMTQMQVKDESTGGYKLHESNKPTCALDLETYRPAILSRAGKGSYGSVGPFKTPTGRTRVQSPNIQDFRR